MPVTAEEAHRAVQYLVDSAAEFAAARADQGRCENMLRVVKSLAMKASGERPRRMASSCGPFARPPK